MTIIQSVIAHDVIGRPKIVLDQFEGLKTLGFHGKVKKYPELFQELFVPSSNITVTPLSVKDALEIPAEMGEDEKNVEHYLLQYLENARSDTLEQFLIFAPGAKSLPRFGHGKIQVKFENMPAIFASTCLLQTTFLCQFEDFDIFT